MRKLVTIAALVATLGCHHFAQKDTFSRVADLREQLKENTYPSDKELELRWHLASEIRKSLVWYTTVRPKKGEADPFHFVLNYCHLARENYHKSLQIGRSSLIELNYEESKKECDKFLTGYF